MTLYLPLVVTSSRLKYQGSRGFLRQPALRLPVIVSQVHFTSSDVNGLPSCHCTPSRSLNVSLVPSSLQAQEVPSSGWSCSRLFVLACWSKTTRLLKTAMKGWSVEIVASSWIEALGGLSR